MSTCETCKFAINFWNAKSAEQIVFQKQLATYGLKEGNYLCDVKLETLKRSFPFRDSYQEGRLAMMVHHCSVSPSQPACGDYQNNGLRPPTSPKPGNTGCILVVLALAIVVSIAVNLIAM